MKSYKNQKCRSFEILTFEKLLLTMNFRYPYDITFNDCCQSSAFNADAKKVDVFSIQQKGVCGPAGGTVVVSEPGNPHSYVAVTGGN